MHQLCPCHGTGKRTQECDSDDDFAGPSDCTNATGARKRRDTSDEANPFNPKNIASQAAARMETDVKAQIALGVRILKTPGKYHTYGKVGVVVGILVLGFKPRTQ